MLQFMLLQLFFQTVGISKIKLSKTDTAILQIFPATALAYTSPYLHTALQPSFYQKASDKAACSGYQYFFLHAAKIIVSHLSTLKYSELLLLYSIYFVYFVKETVVVSGWLFQRLQQQIKTLRLWQRKRKKKKAENI